MRARVEITLEEDGNLNVRFEPDDEIICYGLLEKARQAVEDRAKQMVSKMVRPATALAGLQGFGKLTVEHKKKPS